MKGSSSSRSVCRPLVSFSQPTCTLDESKGAPRGCGGIYLRSPLIGGLVLGLCWAEGFSKNAECLVLCLYLKVYLHCTSEAFVVFGMRSESPANACGSVCCWGGCIGVRPACGGFYFTLDLRAYLFFIRINSKFSWVDRAPHLSRAVVHSRLHDAGQGLPATRVACLAVKHHPELISKHPRICIIGAPDTVNLFGTHV